jgi:catechol 2,3-dioxygenase
MIRPERIGHLVLKVCNLERSRKFYTEVLGLDVMNDAPEIRAVFLASNRRDHHEVALMEVGPDAEAPKENQVGLMHVAFKLRNEDELRAAYNELKAKKVQIHLTVNHGVAKGVYFYDPDGNELELYCDGSPEEYSKMPNPYLGINRLPFATEEPGLEQFFESHQQLHQAPATTTPK